MQLKPILLHMVGNGMQIDKFGVQGEHILFSNEFISALWGHIDPTNRNRQKVPIHGIGKLKNAVHGCTECPPQTCDQSYHSCNCALIFFKS